MATGDEAAMEEAAGMARETMDTSSKRRGPDDDDNESLDSHGEIRPRVTRQRQDEPISAAQVEMVERLAADVARTTTVPEPKPTDAAQSQASSAAAKGQPQPRRAQPKTGARPRKGGKQHL